MPSKKARKKSKQGAEQSSLMKKKAKNFFDLPLELRNIVYHELLTTEKGIEPNVSTTTWHTLSGSSCYCEKHRYISGLQPQILRVNRQMHEEATQILYGYNKFCFLDDDPHRPDYDLVEDSDLDHHDESRFVSEIHDLKLFLIDIGAQNRLLLRHLRISLTRKETLGRKHETNTKKALVKRPRPLGQSFVDGLRLLSQSHKVRSLQIWLLGCKLPLEMYVRKEFLDALCMLSIVPEVKVPFPCECDPDGSPYIMKMIRSKLKESSEVKRSPKNNTNDAVRNGSFTGKDKKEGPEISSARNSVVTPLANETNSSLLEERRNCLARIAKDSERLVAIRMTLEKRDKA